MARRNMSIRSSTNFQLDSADTADRQSHSCPRSNGCWIAGAEQFGREQSASKKRDLLSAWRTIVASSPSSGCNLSQTQIFRKGSRLDVNCQAWYKFPVRRRIGISLVAIAALLAAPINLSARSCIVSDAPIQKACQPGCCANKACCATAQKATPVSQPFVKNNSTIEFNATCVAALVARAPDYISLDRQFSYSRADTRVLKPQLSVLCTLLI
jgi:hypothetical protein